MQLKTSTDHRKQFERGQRDEFDIGILVSLSKSVCSYREMFSVFFLYLIHPQLIFSMNPRMYMHGLLLGSTQPLHGIKQLEVWTDERGLGHGWYADYIAVKDNKTGEEACFLIGQYLNKENGGVADNHLLLDKEPTGASCRERKDDDMDTIETRQMQAVQSVAASSYDSEVATQFRRTYHVDVKTGMRRTTDPLLPSF